MRIASPGGMEPYPHFAVSLRAVGIAAIVPFLFLAPGWSKDQGSKSPGISTGGAELATPAFRETPMGEAGKALALELSWLQGDPTGTSAITIEVVGQPFYLQFIGNELLLDLPEASLPADAVARAKPVMERCQVPRSTITVTTEQGEPASLAVYQASMAGEVDAAVRVSLAVLHEIFAPPADSVLRITRVQG